MKEEIFGLFFDFDAPPSKKFCLMKESGIHRDAVAKHPLRMLEMITIPHLLPIEVEEQDLLIKLNYSYEQKSPLAHLLKGQQLDDFDCLQLIDQLFYPFLEAKNYMLEDHCFLIDDRFVFVDADHLLIYLTYLPLIDIPKGDDSYEQLYQLMLTIVASMKKEKQKDIETVLLPLGESKDIQIIRSVRAELREKMMSYYSNKLPDYKEHRLAQPGFESSPTSDSVDQAIHRELESPEKKPSFLARRKEPEALGLEKKESEVARNSKQLEPLSSKAKTYLYLSILLILSMLWKVYLTYPFEGMLYLCIGLSFLVLNGAIILHKFWRPRLRKSAKKRSLGNKTKKQSEASKLQQKDTALNQHQALDLYQAPKLSKAENTDVQADQYYEQLAQHTQILSSAQTTASTTFLHPNVSQSIVNQEDENDHEPPLNIKKIKDEANLQDEKPAMTNKEAYLVNNSTKKVISMNKTPFLVGRNPQAVSYVESQLGVSRVHFEITKERGEFLVADLGSRNGTFLNGQRLEEHQTHLLKDGDLLQIASLEYTFRAHAEALLERS